MFSCNNQWTFWTLSILQLWNRFSGKREPFFKKLEYCFLVGSTKIENASFPCKTAIPEANVKTNRMMNTKWTYYKKRSFASNCFNFWKFCFSLRTSYKQLIWCTNKPNVHIHLSAGVLLDGAFSLWVSLNNEKLLSTDTSTQYRPVKTMF